MPLDPVLIAYTARRKSDGGTAWNRIGEAYPHETGSGLTVKLDAVPFDGVVILLELFERDHARLAAEDARLRQSKEVADPITSRTAESEPARLTRYTPPSANELQTARRILADQHLYTLTPKEIRALKAIIACHEERACVNAQDVAIARRLFLLLNGPNR
jgi:hypothetical protein